MEDTPNENDEVLDAKFFIDMEFYNSLDDEKKFMMLLSIQQIISEQMTRLMLDEHSTDKVS